MILDLSVPADVILALLPEITLSLWSMVLLVVCAWKHSDDKDQSFVGKLALAGYFVTLVVTVRMWAADVQAVGIAGMIALDGFRFAVDVVLLIASIFAVALSMNYNSREGVRVPEYYPLLMFATIGMMIMAGANDLILVFLGLELMSISVYVLAGINRRSIYSAEAGLKYFLIGAFASAFFLYGIAMIYGSTGTTNLQMMGFQVGSLGLQGNVMFLAGVAMLLIGFAFKVGAVPFHMWAPDVYDGAPTPVTSYMATAVKAAGFAALARLCIISLGEHLDVWQNITWWLAAITMIGGNLLALTQRRLKRMLAYSSIGHAGYLLVAVSSGSPIGAAALLFYMFAYTLMTVGAFAILSVAGRDGEHTVLIDSFAGLASKRPGLALAMTIFMMSLLGFPGTLGFIGKWYILSAAIAAELNVLAVLLVVGSVISAGYYLPVVMAMYMKPATVERAHESTNLIGAAKWVVTSTAILLVLFGVWPNKLLDMARDSAGSESPVQSAAVAAMDR
ncbi:MAG: NADH-quinone oxidoreductase subunit N [Gemmatimonadetes bacterium]|nr:NADH-quinone oxidoreductase subunit N [Gemmatimonadota bacterium]